MNFFDTSKLKAFYTQVSSEYGMTVSEFQTSLRDLFELPRTSDDLRNYRLHRKPWKRLSDEVMPVSRFLQYFGIKADRIRFPLNNEPPDCWLVKDGQDSHTGIEVTIAQGTERYRLAQELVETGMGRGFIGVPDDASKAVFDNVMSRRRVMYSPDSALSSTRDGIRRCLSRKNQSRFAGLSLLIQAPLSNLPQQRWKHIRSDLRTTAATTPFKEVFVISNADGRPWGFRIK